MIQADSESQGLELRGRGGAVQGGGLGRGLRAVRW